MAKTVTIEWRRKPQRHDYLAAESYLSLIMEPPAAKVTAKNLKRAGMSRFAAKDIFRASKLPLLGIDNSHVKQDRAKILRREKLSPILLLRDERHAMLIIADGYHRLCAVYKFDEDAVIPCKIV